MNNIQVLPTFSIYQISERLRRSRQMVNHRRTMELFSYEIENATLKHGAKNHIYASFQYFSRFLPQLERYKQLAPKAHHIYVFGVEDITPPPIENVTYIPLDEGDQLAKEWFIVSFGKEYASILATEELSDINDPDDARIFQGIWTFNPDIVGIVETFVAQMLGIEIFDVDLEHFNEKNNAKLVSQTIERIGNAEKTYPRLNKHSMATVINTEAKSAAKDVFVQVSSVKKTGPLSDKVGGSKKLTVLYSDIVDYDHLSAKLSNATVQAYLRDYINIISETITELGGYVDKILGNGIVGIFGLEPDPESVNFAYQSAKMAFERLQEKTPDLSVGIGIAHNNATVVEIGGLSEPTVFGQVIADAKELIQKHGIFVTSPAYDKLVPDDHIAYSDADGFYQYVAPTR